MIVRTIKNVIEMMIELILVILIIMVLAIFLVEMLSVATHGFHSSPTNLGQAAQHALLMTIQVLKKFF
ncbi:hypothetical protein BXT84_14090 [Sulfobacillus thermotolerans]|uniref:Protein-export membrane protein SecG n=1 Tax=Sulfobacillus thermotolerans TaxID=338644 RepID=A0ABM6RTZ1_9FIRM|nr:hypothetical protein BXT84_14090 [Sulfobacillus thermotolerans]